MPANAISPEKCAQDLLTRLGFNTAPIPVERIAKALGIVLKFSPLDDELSGMIFIKDDIPIVGVNALHHPSRQRFTVAHEIGHLELHRSHLTGEVHVDRKFPVMKRDATTALGTDRREIEANRFASHLLVPTRLLKEKMQGMDFDIDDEKPIEELAKKFRVSSQVIKYRIMNIDG